MRMRSKTRRNLTTALIACSISVLCCLSFILFLNPTTKYPEGKPPAVQMPSAEVGGQTDLPRPSQPSQPQSPSPEEPAVEPEVWPVNFPEPQEYPQPQDYLTPESELATLTVLDEGKCGPELYWRLYDNGLLRISGTGRSYDYCKGLFGDNVTRGEIENYQKDYEGAEDITAQAHYERGFEAGKVYDDENGQYVVPWYKYRMETDFIEYTSRAVYDRDNPNGWTYSKIEVEPGVTYIGNWFFYRVCGPTELILPDTVTEIGQWSIRYSPTLKTVYLPDSVEKIAKRGCSRLEVVEKLYIGHGLKEIGDYAFAQNAKLKTLVVNGKIEQVGTYAFGYNYALERVYFSEIEQLSGVHFVDCNALGEVVFANTVKSIGTVAFVNRPLETVRIPASVSEIGTSAFHGCTKLAQVYIDSATVAKGLQTSTSFGALVSNAQLVYVRSDIDFVGSYLRTAFTNKGEADGYVIYERR